jgi:hypothetical protein
MLTRRTVLGLAVAFSLVSLPLQAGPFQDFESEVRTAYADYRAALFRTNTNDRPASEAAIDRTASKWKVLTGKWSASPPPQYVEDKLFAATLGKIADILNEARAQVGHGKISEAHETLEKIRDELAALRRRNGVIVFSDHMNAYHEQMEKVLLGKYDDFNAGGVMALRGDIAVLAYLLQEIVANPPADRDANYETALNAVRKSVEALREAATKGEADAIKAAIKTLKQPYARLFLNYG